MRKTDRETEKRESQMENEMESCYRVTGSHSAGQWAIKKQHNRVVMAREQHYEPDPGSGKKMRSLVCPSSWRGPDVNVLQDILVIRYGHNTVCHSWSVISFVGSILCARERMCMCLS